LNKFLSRKFFVTLAAVFSASFLAYLGILDNAAYSSVVITVSGAYMGTNVYQSTNLAKGQEKSS